MFCFFIYLFLTPLIAIEPLAVCRHIWANEPIIRLSAKAHDFQGIVLYLLGFVLLEYPTLELFLPECVTYPYHAMAVALFPIILCLHLTHQTVAVPAARAPAQITTRQLIELFFSSQAGGHCKNIPTLEYGFLVQVRHQ